MKISSSNNKSERRTAPYKTNNNFEGSHPQMIGSYYTYNPDQPAVDQYQETTDKLIDIVCSSFKEPQLLKASIKSLTKHTPEEPQLQLSGYATDSTGKRTSTPISTKQDELKYNIQFKEWQYRISALAESLNKTFTIVYGQCSRTMKARIEEDPNWETIDSKCDPLGLLTIIKSIAHNNESQRNPTISLILAEKRLMNMVQGENQSNDSFRIKFQNQADVIQNMGGQLYRNSTLDIASNEMYKKDFDTLSNDSERTKVKAAATELWKASLFITNSNLTKFDQLKKELHNDYISGDKTSYPTTFNEAYHLINQYKPFGSNTILESHGTAFHQQSRSRSNDGVDSDNSNDDGAIKAAPKRFEKWVCSVCGDTGHPPSPKYCPIVKAINSDEKLKNKLKATGKNDSEVSESDSSKSKSRLGNSAGNIVYIHPQSSAPQEHKHAVSPIATTNVSRTQANAVTQCPHRHATSPCFDGAACDLCGQGTAHNLSGIPMRCKICDWIICSACQDTSVSEQVKQSFTNERVRTLHSKENLVDSDDSEVHVVSKQIPQDETEVVYLCPQDHETSPCLQDAVCDVCYRDAGYQINGGTPMSCSACDWVICSSCQDSHHPKPKTETNRTNNGTGSSSVLSASLDDEDEESVAEV